MDVGVGVGVGVVVDDGDVVVVEVVFLDVVFGEVWWLGVVGDVEYERYFVDEVGVDFWNYVGYVFVVGVEFWCVYFEFVLWFLDL